MYLSIHICRYRICIFLDTGAFWKRSYMAQNQLRHHITFSYFPSCDLDAIFTVECPWHSGDFAQTAGKMIIFEITFITKKCVPAPKIANFDNKTACGGAHQRCASRLHNPVEVDPPSSGCSIRFPNSLCGLAERAGCILRYVDFLLRHWCRFNPVY